MEPKNLPVGYWIKQADNLLTEGINRIHEVNGLNRSAWQLLHLLSKQTTSDIVTIIEIIEPFGDAGSIHEILNNLLQKTCF
ncbi:MAG: hypothetical protein V4717_15330 [Bacteroidota bacterium]